MYHRMIKMYTSFVVSYTLRSNDFTRTVSNFDNRVIY